MPSSADRMDYEVTISDDLKAILRPDTSVEEATLPTQSAPIEEVSEDVHGHRSVKLRRDGARPVWFKGTQVLKLEVDERELGQGRQVLTVYSQQNGQIVAQVVVEPPEDLPARPVYSVSPIASAGDLRALIDHGTPENVLIPSAETYADGPAFGALFRQNQQLSEVIAPFLRCPSS